MIKRLTLRLLTWLTCKWNGHAFKKTDVFHISWDKLGYVTDEYYVVSCARCGHRQERVCVDSPTDPEPLSA